MVRTCCDWERSAWNIWGGMDRARTLDTDVDCDGYPGGSGMLPLLVLAWGGLLRSTTHLGTVVFDMFVC
jgi:uncharacterized protein (TIGR03382 family)